MNCEIVIPEGLVQILLKHFFQNDLEQAGFLFATTEIHENAMRISAQDLYLVPPAGWDFQSAMQLQMSDAERAKILKLARDKGLALIDCHSHPHSGDDVWFSGSDVAGTTEFASYVNWKLGGKPFAALVWGEKSVDAVCWHGEFNEPQRVDEVRFGSNKLLPKNTWFNRRFWKNRYEQE